MSRVLVTGGAGFIGSHVADALVARGEEVCVLDLAGRRDHLDPAVEHVVGDVCDPAAVARALRGVDRVLHQAAKVGLGTDLGDLPAYARANDLGTAVLLRALAARPPAALVLGSSMVVYGEGSYACPEHGPVRPGPRAREDLAAGRFEPRCPACGRDVVPGPVGEDAAPDPRNVYAATKLHQEHLATAFSRETGTPAAALRYHNVYGPRMPRDTPYAGVAAIFRSALAAGRPPEVFEDGGQLRDFVSVHDVARANLLALDARAHGAFNVCSGVPRTVGALAEGLADAAGPGAPRPRTTGAFRLGDVRHVFADPGRAARELGFRAAVPFADGLAAFSAAPVGQSP